MPQYEASVSKEYGSRFADTEALGDLHAGRIWTKWEVHKTIGLLTSEDEIYHASPYITEYIVNHNGSWPRVRVWLG